MYRLQVVALDFADATSEVPAGWTASVARSMDMFFGEISGGRIRWAPGADSRIRLPRPSARYHLRRRTLADRMRFWRRVMDAIWPAIGDALLVVIPDEARIRGCFAIGPRWNSPRMDAALAALGGRWVRGAVVRASTPWGTLAHELGHVLGFPDLYDYRLGRRNASFTASRYIGAWDLMGRPPEDSEGARPHPMAWTKALAGWIRIEDWDPGRTTYTVTAGADPVALRVPLCNGTHLYMEARLRHGFDQVLPSEGVLLSRADERRPQGRGPLRMIAPRGVLGPHWNAVLRPGDTRAYRGWTVRVADRLVDGFTLMVART